LKKAVHNGKENTSLIIFLHFGINIFKFCPINKGWYHPLTVSVTTLYLNALIATWISCTKFKINLHYYVLRGITSIHWLWNINHQHHYFGFVVIGVCVCVYVWVREWVRVCTHTRVCDLYVCMYVCMLVLFIKYQQVICWPDFWHAIW
jgi:hypothetical protein